MCTQRNGKRLLLQRNWGESQAELISCFVVCMNVSVKDLSYIKLYDIVVHCLGMKEDTII